MAKTLALLFLLLGSLSFGQSLIGKLSAKENRVMWLDDTSVLNFSNEYAMNLNYVVYHSSDFYHLKNGNKVGIHEYRDSTIFYEEKDSVGRLLFTGELVIDYSKLNITPIPSVSEEGEDSMIYDTSYFLVQNGVWLSSVDWYHLQSTHYYYGKKEGLSETKLVFNCNPYLEASLNKELYNNDLKIESSYYTLPDAKKIQTLIYGEWYHPWCGIRELMEGSLWIFLRDDPGSMPSNGPYHSNFKQDGNFEGKNQYSCGTGRDESDYRPKYKWRITDDGSLVIGEGTFQIIYIDEKMMVIK